jgi:lysophospholipase L1-like esterase
LKRLAPVLLLVGVVAACGLAAELAAARLGFLEYPPAMNRGHPTRGYTLRAGFQGESKLGIPFSVGTHGFRSPELAVPKPAGTRRVLVLGDSVAWGAGIREEETFARRLEAALRESLDCPVEVVNAGVSGYGSIEELDVLRHEGLGFEPDVVLVYHVENDNLVRVPVGGSLATALKDAIVYRSHLVGALLQGWRTLRWRAEAARRGGGERDAYVAELRAWDRRPGTEASLAALREIAELAKRNGAQPILASHPSVITDRSSDAVRNERLREVASQAGMPFVDVEGALLPVRDRPLAVSETDLHPNAFAHARIADWLRVPVGAALGCAARAGATG